MLKWMPQDLLNFSFDALSSGFPLKAYHELAK